MTLPTGIAGTSRRDLLPLAALALVLATWIVWVGASGAYSQNVWYPSALGALSLWGVVVVWGGRLLPEVRAARFALLAFAGLVAFNYLSILWAGSPGSALDASNELALYLLVAWTLALLPWTAGRLALFMGLWSLGIFAICAIDLARAVSSSSLTVFFVNGRFANPMQYSNATGAVAVMGMWPGLVLSSRRELKFWLRACCLGIAAFLAAFSTLPQSRAALLGLAVTAVVALVVSSGRVRLLSRMLVVGGAVALCLPRTIDVDDAINAGRRVDPALHHAAAGMLISGLAAVVLGLLLGLVEDRFSARRATGADGPTEPPRGGSRLAGRVNRRQATVALAALAVVVVVIAGVAAEPKVSHFVHTVIKQGNTDADTGSTRILSASPEERVDYARVALHLFSGAPLAGVGSGNFGRHYDEMRKFTKHSQYTHDLPLRVLSETGIIGTLLFLGMIGALLVGLGQLARSRRDLGRACVTIALAVSAYFLVHSCLDWVDEFPALAAPAIGLPFAALALGRGAQSAAISASSEPASLGVLRPVAAVAAVAAGVALFVAMAAPYLSLQYTNRAFAIFRSHPQQAYHDLDVARSLNPISVDPLTSKGTVALYAGSPQRSQAAFTSAVEKQDDWYPRLELALIDAHDGRFAPALAQLDAAAVLDVHDPLITEARSDITAHRRIDPIAFNALITQEANSSASTQQTVR